MYKKFTKILLLIILLSPLSVYALKDRVTVSSTGWNYDYFSTYNWKGTSSKEMTKKDCEKQGGKIDPNTEVAEWVQYRATCSAEKKGKKSSSEAYGTKKIKAEVTCKQNVVKAMKSKGVKITVKDVKINGSGVYLKQYSKTRPGKDMAKSGNTDNYRYMCSVSKSGVSEKALPHETLSANGETAYCLLPGKPFKSGGDTYILKKSFDISNCKKTTDALECMLAQTFIDAKNAGASDMATLMALRFVAAKMGHGSSGFWDGKNLFNKANIYGMTQNYIDSNGYTGSTKSPKNGIIYSKGHASELSQAISIYNGVKNGKDMWTPKIELKSSELNNGVLTVKIETNFPTDTNIDYIKLSNGMTADTITKEPCGDKLCITFTVQMKSEDCKGPMDIIIGYNNSKDMISKVGYYVSASDPSKYQDAWIFEPGQAEAKLKDADLCDAKVCEQDPETGKCYGLNGQEIDCSKMDEECNNHPGDYCPNDGKPIDEMPSDCEESNTGKYYDKVMCTVLNSNPTVKSKYYVEYGDTYGGSYCEMYCRESNEFTFMDVETVKAGRSFKHHLTAKGIDGSDFSVVVESKRQCASVIDYERWLGDYKSTNDQILEIWNQYSQWKTNANHEINEPTPYSCPGCSGTCPTTCTGKWVNGKCNGKISGGKPYRFDAGPSGLLNHYHTVNGVSNNYGFTNSRILNEKEYIGAIVNTVQNSTSYDAQDTLKYICECDVFACNVTPVESSKVIAARLKIQYDNLINKRKKLIKYIKNCNIQQNTETYNEIIKYDVGNEIDINYYNEVYNGVQYNNLIPHPTTMLESETMLEYAGYGNPWIYDSNEWKDYCGDCGGSLEDLGSSTDKDLVYYECSGEETSAKCINKPQRIPTNGIASVRVSKTTAHYQGNEICTQLFTGTVANSSNGEGYWVCMGDKLYPTSPNTLTGKYPLEIDYKNIGSTDRRKLAKFRDGSLTCAYQVINDLNKYDCDDNFHECYTCDDSKEDCDPIDDDDPRTKGFGMYFRSVDTTDLFPNSQYSPTKPGVVNTRTRTIGRNWVNAIDVINSIQSIENILEKEPQYVIELNAKDIKEIREYNKDVNDYLDYSLDCEDSYRCYSTFLTKFNNIVKTNNMRNMPNGSIYFYQR